MLPASLSAPLRRGTIRLFMRAGAVPGMGRLSRTAMRLAFDRLAPHWDAIRADPVYLERLGEALDQLARRTGTGTSPSRILDVGCGSGLALRLLSRRHPEAALAGVDISPRMVAAAREALPHADLRVADATSTLPWKDGAFDLLVALDGVFSARELARLCAPGGAIVLVYTFGGQMPVARDPDGLAEELRQAGLTAQVQRQDSWVVWASRD